MTRVLLIGIKPEAVDVSDPDLPPGITPEKIAAGIDAPLADMKARGWEGAFCSILPDGSAGPALVRAGHQRRPSRRCRDADRVQHLPRRYGRRGGEMVGREVA